LSFTQSAGVAAFFFPSFPFGTVAGTVFDLGGFAGPAGVVVVGVVAVVVVVVVVVGAVLAWFAGCGGVAN